VAVQPDLWVANMVAQHGMRPGRSGPPIRYDAVERCLEAVAHHANRLGASVHMPRIGCGLAGGKWELIEPIITRTLCAHSIVTTVYGRFANERGVGADWSGGPRSGREPRPLFMVLKP
jgi:O-acetyl-ADP-ribose deacetylase (regulator of RNase III)